MTSPDPETELIRRVDAFGAAAMGFDSPVEPEASRQKQRYEYARARLLVYVEQNMLTPEEARSVYEAVEYLNFGHAELAAALEKLHRWSSPPAATEEEVKP